jgi:hypothetical protein
MEDCMSVLIISNKICRHRQMLEEQLKSMDISYTVKFVEEYPELIKRYNILTALIIVLEEKVVFRHTCEKPLPTLTELQNLFQS